MNVNKETFGEIIKRLREEKGLPLRKVAAALDIDTATLSKIESNKRKATRPMTGILAQLFEVDARDLLVALLSDRVMYEILDETQPEAILKVAAEKIKYFKNKNTTQGNIDF